MPSDPRAIIAEQSKQEITGDIGQKTVEVEPLDMHMAPKEEAPPEPDPANTQRSKVQRQDKDKNKSAEGGGEQSHP